MRTKSLAEHERQSFSFELFSARYIRFGRSTYIARELQLKKAVFVILVGILFGIGVLTVWVRMRIKTDRSPTITQEVANFNETLDPTIGPVTVKVFAIKKESAGLFDTHDIRSSRVDIEGSNPQMLLITGLAARSVQVIDLDRNGTKELLFLGEDAEAAVVWMKEGQLSFRPEHDLLNSVLDSTPQDAGGRHMVFVVATAGIYTNGMHGVARQRVMAWTEQDGFRDVTVLFPKFVRKMVISSLKKEMASEDDAERKKNFHAIIAELEDLIKSPAAK